MSEEIKLESPTGRWLCINGSVLAAVMWGIENNNGIGTLGVILLWINTLSQFIRITEKAAEQFQPSAPRWLSVAYDVFLALFLANRGWVWSAVVVIIGAGIEDAARKKWEATNGRANDKLCDPP